MTCLRIQVRGKVQGVFFRVSTRDRAISLGLKGWVRNESDSSVLIEVEGPDEKIEAFKKWCWTGSPLSRVDEVVIEKKNPGNYTDFRISY